MAASTGFHQVNEHLLSDKIRMSFCSWWFDSLRVELWLICSFWPAQTLLIGALRLRPLITSLRGKSSQ